jgi:hypothetical protein
MMRQTRKERVRCRRGTHTALCPTPTRPTHTCTWPTHDSTDPIPTCPRPQSAGTTRMHACTLGNNIKWWCSVGAFRVWPTARARHGIYRVTRAAHGARLSRQVTARSPDQGPANNGGRAAPAAALDARNLWQHTTRMAGGGASASLGSKPRTDAARGGDAPSVAGEALGRAQRRGRQGSRCATVGTTHQVEVVVARGAHAPAAGDRPASHTHTPCAWVMAHRGRRGARLAAQPAAQRPASNDSSFDTCHSRP